MGVYVYSARAEVREIDGLGPVGKYQFAYKPSFNRFDRGRFGALCARLDSAGYRAADKLNDQGIKLMAFGDWPKSEGEAVNLLEVKQVVGVSYDSCLDKNRWIGKLVKRGRKLVYDPSISDSD